MSAGPTISCSPQRDKRARLDESSSPDDGFAVSVKRVCHEISASEPERPLLFSLEELCELESPLEANVAESCTQEELVSEMMRSLEKAIGAIENGPSAQLPHSPPPQLPHSADPLFLPLSCGEETNFSGSAPFSRSELASTSSQTYEVNTSDEGSAELGRDLLDCVDDAPCVPDCAWLELAYPDVSCAESSATDDRCSNSSGDAASLPNADLALFLRNDWRDEFAQFDAPGLESGRECCDLVSLDYCF